MLGQCNKKTYGQSRSFFTCFHTFLICVFVPQVFTIATIFTKPGFSPTTVVASAVAAVILLLSLVLVLVLVLVKKMNQRKEARAPGVVDMNPVYGMYYFADGEQIDAGKSEVVDDNDYYDSWENVPL